MGRTSLPFTAHVAVLLRGGLASWRAAPLEHYAAASQASVGVRRFGHAERHSLQDGGELALEWTIDADPAAVLSMDVEQKHGVQMLHCQPDHLVLHLPGEHVRRIEAFQHIVASRHVHRCEHLQGQHLYHRIVHVIAVKYQRPPLDGVNVEFSTRELASASEVVPHAAFSFRFIPAEAKHKAHGSRRLEECVDMVWGWEDLLGRSCTTYLESDFCTSSGDYGKGWNGGLFEHYAGSKYHIAANDACCACGGGRSPDLEVAAIPVYFSHNPECRKEAHDFGTVDDVNICAALVEAEATCDEHFVFDGKLRALPGRCRCCDAEGGWGKHTMKPIWTLWRAVRMEEPHDFYSAPGGVDQALDEQSIFNFVPRQVANFGWNWDFKNKKVKESQFRLQFPGGVGYVEFTKPSVRVHAGLVVNFTSHSTDLEPPDVRLLATLEGHAFLNGDMAALIDSKWDAEEGLLAHLAYEKLGETTYLDPLEFFLGSIPVTLVPGVFLGLNAYHAGQLRGTMRVGVEAHLQVKVSLEYDSQKGLHSDISASTVDVQFWPPTWLVSSKKFDISALLGAEVWLKGSVGDIRNAKLGLNMRSSLNMSVDQDEDLDAGRPKKRRLAVYPFRAVGLPPGEEYAVKVSVAEQASSTSTQLSFGVVEYSDHVAKFDFGLMTETELLMLPIKVSLLHRGQEPAVASTEVTCDSLVNGECQPSPVQARLRWKGHEAVVQLSILWQFDPLAWISNKIRSISIGFNSVSLSPAMSAKVADATDKDKVVALLVKRNGRKFGARVEVNASDRKAVTLHSNITYEFGLCYLDVWRVPSSVDQPDEVLDLLTPSLQLLVDNEVVGENMLPPMDWSQSSAIYQDSAETDVFESDAEKQAKSAGALGNIPVSMALYDKNKESIGSSRLDIGVNDQDAASYFIYPSEVEKLPKGAHHDLSWTVDSSEDEILSFTLGALEVGDKLDFVPMSFQKQVKQACSDSGAKSKKYIQKPFSLCTWKTNVKVDEVLAGRRVVFTMRWSHGEHEHVMISAPVDCLATSTPSGGRSLAAPLPMSSRHLDEDSTFNAGPFKVHASHIDFDAKMKELNPKCSEKPLKYSIKVGVFAKTEISSFRLPAALTAFGGVAETPAFSSHWVPIKCTEAMEKLNAVLMAGSCEDGRCDGTLPACKPGAMPAEEIPRLRVQLSRDFDWTNATLMNVRKIFAYGLAVLPEVLDIIVMNADEAKDDTERRLHANDSDGRKLSDNFVVSFRQPLPFRLDGPLVEALLHGQAWRGLSDGQDALVGPATISRWSLLPSRIRSSESGHSLLDLSEKPQLAAAGTSLRAKPGAHAVGAGAPLAAYLLAAPVNALTAMVLFLLVSFALLAGCRHLRASTTRERYEVVLSESGNCE